MITSVRKLQTLEHKVEYCLERYTDAKNSDIDLFARVCENFYPPFESAIYNWRDLAGAMHAVPSLDHIARVRRKIIRKHGYRKYLPTELGIALHRGLNEKVWREYATTNNITNPADHASNIPVGYNDDGEYIGNADPRARMPHDGGLDHE